MGMTRSQIILAVVVVGGFILITILFILTRGELLNVPEWFREILLLITGAWITMVQQVVSYVFGSSQGSKDKTDALVKAVVRGGDIA